MRKTKYTVKPTAQFKKDYKLAMKRGLKINLLEDVIAALAMGEALPEKNKDHALTGNFSKFLSSEPPIKLNNKIIIKGAEFFHENVRIRQVNVIEFTRGVW